MKSIRKPATAQTSVVLLLCMASTIVKGQDISLFSTPEPSIQRIGQESLQDSISNLTLSDILNEQGEIVGFFQVSLDPDQDLLLTTPVGLTLAVLFSIITGVGLIANGIVFFVIIAGNEIGKRHYGTALISFFIFPTATIGEHVRVVRMGDNCHVLCLSCKTRSRKFVINKICNYFAIHFD